MGKFWALPLAAMVMGISAGFTATPAQADDQTAFHAACPKPVEHLRDGRIHETTRRADTRVDLAP